MLREVIGDKCTQDRLQYASLLFWLSSLKCITGAFSCKSALTGWRETEGERGLFYLYNRPPQCHHRPARAPNPQSPVPSTPANSSSSPLLFLCRLLLFPEGDQLTATSWGGPEASCLCQRNLLASGLHRMDRAAALHSHSTLPALRHVTNIYKLGGGFGLKCCRFQTEKINNSHPSTHPNRGVPPLLLGLICVPVLQNWTDNYFSKDIYFPLLWYFCVLLIQCKVCWNLLKERSCWCDTNTGPITGDRCLCLCIRQKVLFNLCKCNP